MNTVQLRDAKAGLSKLLDQAKSGEPTLITRHGRREGVLMSIEDAATGVPDVGAPTAPGEGNFGAFLLSFPGGIEFERDRTSTLRPVDFD